MIQAASQTTDKASGAATSLVNGLGWTSLVLSGLGVYSGISTAISLNSPEGLALLQMAVDMAGGRANLPPTIGLIMDHLAAINAGLLGMSALMMLLSGGLLKRWNWARLGFMGVLGLGALLSCLPLILGLSGPSPAEGADAELLEALPPGLNLLFNGILAALGVLLHGWLMLALHRPAVRRLFASEAC